MRRHGPGKAKAVLAAIISVYTRSHKREKDAR